MTEAEWMASDDPAKMLRWVCDEDRLGTPGFCRKPSDRKLRLFAVACCRAVWHLLTDSVPCERCDGGFVREKYQGGAAGLETRSREVHCPDCHGTGTINRSRRAVEVAELFADGLATTAELKRENRWLDDEAAWGSHGWLWCFVATAPDLSRWLAGVRDRPPALNAAVPPATQANLLREIVGNPWRRVTLPVGESVRCSCSMYGNDGSVLGMLGNWEPCLLCKETGKITACPWLSPTVLAIAREAYDSRDFSCLPVLADALEEAGSDSQELLTHLRSNAIHVRGCWALDLILGKD